jgi:hypothetical protein
MSSYFSRGQNNSQNQFVQIEQVRKTSLGILLRFPFSYQNVG